MVLKYVNSFASPPVKGQEVFACSVEHEIEIMSTADAALELACDRGKISLSASRRN